MKKTISLLIIFLSALAYSQDVKIQEDGTWDVKVKESEEAKTEKPVFVPPKEFSLLEVTTEEAKFLHKSGKKSAKIIFANETDHTYEVRGWYLVMTKTVPYARIYWDMDGEKPCVRKEGDLKTIEEKELKSLTGLIFFIVFLIISGGFLSYVIDYDDSRIENWLKRLATFYRFPLFVLGGAFLLSVVFPLEPVIITMQVLIIIALAFSTIAMNSSQTFGVGAFVTVAGIFSFTIFGDANTPSMSALVNGFNFFIPMFLLTSISIIIDNEASYQIKR